MGVLRDALLSKLFRVLGKLLRQEHFRLEHATLGVRDCWCTICASNVSTALQSRFSRSSLSRIMIMVRARLRAASGGGAGPVANMRNCSWALAYSWWLR